MDVLEPSEWPSSPLKGAQIERAVLVDKALEVLADGGVVRLTEADLVEVPNKSLALLAQSVSRYAKKDGFRLANRFITEADGTRALYIRRIYKRQ